MNRIIFFVLLFTFISNYFIYSDDVYKKSVKGYLDLSKLDFEKSNLIYLDGEWELYYDKLLTPLDFDTKKITPDGFIVMPNSWDSVIVDNKKLPWFGKATFKINLKLPINENNRYALIFPVVNSAMKIWINNNNCFNVGKIADTKEQMTPLHKTVIIPFEIKDPNVTIVLNVSNFHIKSGGFWKSIKIGYYEKIKSTQTSFIAYKFFIFGALLLIGFYHFVIFFFRT
ncbi:MAG TPA: hypothetical protein PK771_12590, partial [Spirochaetota bacterium]|nr:hypothetical protein [Spirochaetota bacterium]